MDSRHFIEKVLEQVRSIDHLSADFCYMEVTAVLHFLAGAAGTGKSHKIMEIIGERASAGCSVLVIVPEQFSYEFDRKLYSSLGAQLFNRIETHSFTSLARGIFQRLGGGETGSYMDELMQMGLTLQAISRASKEMRCFGKQCSSG